MTENKAPRPALFLDRDGVINRKPPAGDYILRWEQVEFLPAVFDWIRLFRAAGFAIVVVTNQRCVARGMLSAAELARIHAQMSAAMAAHGAAPDAIYCCPHAQHACDCRKPKPGLILRAQAELNLDLTRSLVVGDSENDRQLAAGLGIPFSLVDEGRVLESAGV